MIETIIVYTVACISILAATIYFFNGIVSVITKKENKYCECCHEKKICKKLK